MATVAELQRALNSASNRVSRFAKEHERLTTIVLSVGGQLIGGLVAGSAGFLERRFPMKDGSPFGFGPVPLTHGLAGIATLASAIIRPGVAQDMASHTAASLWGAVFVTYGRAWGQASKIKALAKKGKVSGVHQLDGDDDDYEAIGDGGYDYEAIGDGGYDDEYDDEPTDDEAVLLGYRPAA